MANASLKKGFKLESLLKGEIKKLKDFSFIDTKTLNEIAESVIEHIQVRTLEGYDKTGKPFEGYTNPDDPKSHAAKRRKAGLQTNYADLSFEGDLLSGIHIDKLHNNGNFKIAVNPDDYGKLRGAVEGIKRKVGGKVVRDFWGLGRKDKVELRPIISKLVSEAYADYLKKK